LFDSFLDVGGLTTAPESLDLEVSFRVRLPSW
jgi:hypothetical protein